MMVVQAAHSDDFDEVLRWQSRIDELAAGHDQGTIFLVLQAFARAFSHAQKWDSAGMMWVRCASGTAVAKPDRRACGGTQPGDHHAYSRCVRVCILSHKAEGQGRPDVGEVRLRYCGGKAGSTSLRRDTITGPSLLSSRRSRVRSLTRRSGTVRG